MVEIGSVGVLSPGKWRWLRAMAWMAVLCVAIVLAFNGVAKAVQWLIALDLPLDPRGKLAAAIAGCIAILALYCLAVRYGERRPVYELSLRGALSELLLGMAAGAGAIAVVIAVQWALGWVTIESRSIDAVAIALRNSIRSGILEELVLRLVIFRLLWRAFGVWPALGLSAVTFGVLHLANPDSGGFAAVCLIAGEGIGIGFYLLTRRIWASIGMHAAWNFTQGWIFGAIVSGTTEIAGGPLALRPATGVSEALSGGAFGPEASLPALIVSLIASAIVLRLAWLRHGFEAAPVAALQIQPALQSVGPAAGGA
jgi:membrane protease YdiL (CAAX protease family)